MLISFADASRVTAVGDHKFLTDVPDGWQQGRGAFGGLGIAIAIRALEKHEPDRPLRALTAELPGPLMPGAARIETRVLRRGKGLTSLEATVVQDDEVKVRASGLFGAARGQDVALEPSTPAFDPNFDAVAPLPVEVLPPRFARNFEYRVTGALPFSSGRQPVAEGWIRLRTKLDRWGPAEVAALADAYWPSIFATFDTFRPMATVTFSLMLTEAALDLDPDLPLFYRARSLCASAGYVPEIRELWTRGGELVALNPQTFVVIK